MYLMRADPLRGQVGGDYAQKPQRDFTFMNSASGDKYLNISELGLSLEIKSFLGPVRWHYRRVPFGAQKTRDFQGPTQLRDIYLLKPNS
jgi:hypothetical protein